MSILRRGDRGSEVVTLQTALARAGYFNAGADGVFGEQTEQAVKNFQQAMGLTVDGIVGAKTWAALAPYMQAGPSYPPYPPYPSYPPYPPVTPGPVTLRRGDRGPAVLELQRALQTAGYDVGAIDGIFGSQTEAAVKKFQQVFGLSTTGVVAAAEWNLLEPFRLDPDPLILRRGSVGNRVTQLQSILTRLGYYTYNIDGLFGTRTERAVRNFQSAYGLPVTGVVDAATAERLGLYGNTPVYPPARPPQYITYTVQPGDTLFSIAKRYNTTVAALLNANPRANPDLIYVGETLIIPRP